MTSIFFVHGMWTTPRIWQSYQRYFEGLGYRTTAPALPQHFSRNQAYQVEGLRLIDYVDHMEEAYREISDSAQDIVIVGHGMGCIVALQLAMRVNPKSIVLLSPEVPGHISANLPPVKALPRTLLTPFYWKRGLKPDQKCASELLLNGLPEAEHGEYFDYLCYESGQVLHETWCWLADPSNASRIDRAQISCPILCMAGEDDKLCSARSAKALSRHLGQTRHFHKLKGFAHLIPLEDTEFEAARQIHIWLCWHLGLQSPQTQAEGLNTATL